MPLFTSRYSTDTAATGAKCSLTGWGTTRAGASTLPTNLQLVYVDIVDHERCAQGYANSQGVDDKMICAGVRGGGKDSCQGDGGGPLVETASGKQVGVVSWGFGCGRHGRDGVYTSTAAYLPWI
ncbi:trypsin-like cysteine/serine peptidase domain-containing protein [Aspergillus oleicola]